MKLEPRRKTRKNGYSWAVWDKNNNSWYTAAMVMDYPCKKDCIYAIRYLLKEGI